MNSHTLRQMVRAPADETQAGGSTGTISQAKEKISNTARDTAARIKSAASETASRAKSEAERMVAEKKDGAAERIGGYSSAMHESAKSFESQDPNIAWAAHNVADRIQRVADYVRTSDFTSLRNDVEGFARRHPVAFFGGLVVGGLVIGNLLKARPEAGNAGYSDDADWEGLNQGTTDNLETGSGQFSETGLENEDAR